MWTVKNGKLAYVPVTPKRSALGPSYVPDVVEQIEKNHRGYV